MSARFRSRLEAEPNETLIYHEWYIDISDPDMSLSIEAQSSDYEIASSILYQLRLPGIIIGIMKENVPAANILKEGLNIARDLGIREVLLALGPTSPLSLGCSSCQKILWTTFFHNANLRKNWNEIVVPPTHLTDLSVDFEKLSGTENPARLLMGDFLDSVLPVSTDSATFAFLCNLLTRIRETGQTAFFLLTEDMHDLKKITMVKRFADVLIEYRRTQEDGKQGVETRILDFARDHFSDWQTG
jgi:hypothetical protein